MADGAQKNRLVPAELINGRIREHFAGAQIPLAPEIVMRVFHLESFKAGHGVQHLNPLADNLGAGSVSGHHADIVAPGIPVCVHNYVSFQAGLRPRPAPRATELI